MVIDPGMDVMTGIAELVAEHRLRPIAVLLTHGHIDHMWSVVPVANGYGVPALIHASDRPLLSDPTRGLSPQAREALQQMAGGGPEFVEPSELIEVTDGLTIDLAGIEWRVDHAPGHTPGSVTYSRGRSTDLPPVMFSGDVLFAGSIGRTDLPGGSTDDMLASLARVVLPCDDDTVVLPGHGEQTTIGRERVSNPFLRDLLDSDSTEFHPTIPSRGL